MTKNNMKRKKKDGRGRPALPEAERQSVVVQCRATVAERDRWTAATLAAGTTVGDEIRKCLRRLALRHLGPETVSPASPKRSNAARARK